MLTSELTVHMLKCIVRGYACCPLIHDSLFIEGVIGSANQLRAPESGLQVYNEDEKLPQQRGAAPCPTNDVG